MCKVHEGQVIMRTYTKNIQFMHRCNNCFFHLSAQSEMAEQDKKKRLVYIILASPHEALCVIFMILVSFENVKKCVLGGCTITSKTKINGFYNMNYDAKFSSKFSV